MRAMFRGEVHSSSGGTSRNRGGHSRSIESEPVFNTISLKDISTTASDALSSTRAGDYSVASTRKGDMNGELGWQLFDSGLVLTCSNCVDIV